MSQLKEKTFEEKLELLKELLDDLEITFDGYYGAEGYAGSVNVTNEGEKIRIWTGINTG